MYAIVTVFWIVKNCSLNELVGFFMRTSLTKNAGDWVYKLLPPSRV